MTRPDRLDAYSRFPGTARWSEAASGLADGIETGRYAAGEPLGTVEELARASCVSRRTMLRVLRELAATGYVVKRGRWHVSGDPPRRQPPRPLAAS
jgi:DNA-binding FadR family transcriptional regulator